MADKRRRSKVRSSHLPSMDDLKAFIRSEGVFYLKARNVNSVGIGRKISTKKGPTGEICIQFTVDRKVAPEAVGAVGSIMIPPVFVIKGKTVPSDVIERRFHRAWQLVPEDATEKDDRKARQDPVVPGLSIGHHDGTAGTIGAVVFDRESGAPLLLSNWHVLQMRADETAGTIGDEVLQPGPF